MEELSYSLWHRSLGYSYFAMDLDYVEIRDDKPVALIEASLCTPSHPSCSGEKNVFNRFLSETGGFQFEVVYWSALWLGVNAYVVCMKKSSENSKGEIEILSLANGELAKTNIAGFKEFIRNLPETNSLFSQTILELPELLEKLASIFPGIRVYPYFKDREAWMVDYQIRLDEVKNRLPRNRVPKAKPEQHPVKGETTGERPKDYEILRDEIDLPYININWVEWRKDNPKQKIGRPAAIVKSVPVVFTATDYNQDLFESEAEKRFADFITSKEAIGWTNTASKMKVNWYYVAYPVLNNAKGSVIGEQFIVWRADKHIFKKQQYTEWLTTF